MISDTLFDTEAKRNAAIAAFTTLQNSEGWKLLEAIWDTNIEVLRQQLENGVSEHETTADVNRTRDKLKQLREIRNTPADMIKRLMPQEGVEVNIDPYETVDELRMRKEEAIDTA